MTTLCLDRTTWDLFLDTPGNIALASGPYALAQDAASAIKLFAGELYYDTSQGVPYFSQILGEFPSLQFMKAQFEAAALTVPGVITASCTIASFTGRTLVGQVQITDSTGITATAGF